MGRVADIVQQGSAPAGGAGSAAAELWRFSLALYARPGVSAALIALQDRAGLDVNLILFALWLGLSGRGQLDREGFARADHAVHALRVGIIEPLRVMRRRLKPDPDADIQRLREAIKMIELEAEKTAQHRLAAGARPPGAETDPAMRLSDADANLALWLGPETAQGTEAAIILDALQGFLAGS